MCAKSMKGKTFGAMPCQNGLYDLSHCTDTNERAGV